MGIILPLLSDKFKSIWKTTLLAIVATLAIEIIQLITKRGIFSIDDIFNNTLGAVIGYGIVLSFLTIISKTQNKAIKIGKYLAPLCFTLIAFAFIFISYNLQEFGNMQKSVGSASADIIGNKLLSDMTQINGARSSAQVYSAKIANHEEADELANKIFASNGETYSDKYVYSESTLYKSNKGSSLNIIYKGLIYFYSTSSENDINSALDESFVRQSLNKFGVVITEDMEYSRNSYGEYMLKADMLSVGDYVYNGVLTCAFSNDGTIQQVDNQMMELTSVKSCEIISSEEAFELAKKEYSTFDEYDEIFEAKAFSIEYNSLDTKGFLQPMYVFYDYKDEYILTITIPALVK